MTYEERDTSFNDSGRWELAGNLLVLHGSHNATDKFGVRDADTLRRLDINGHEIVSQFNYDLKRMHQSASGGNEAATGASIENTHWKLTALGDTPVAPDSAQREAFLLLDPEQHRVSGSGGCNSLAGSYELNGEQLKFSRMAGTKMACPKGMDTEQTFLQFLGRVASWKITGPSLELFDADGKLLAQFKAREN
jgi:heat shock protein HslJ